MQTSSVNSNGVLLSDATPLFPFGFFDVSDDDSSADPFAALQARIALMGAAGFNTLLCNAWDFNEDDATAAQQWMAIYEQCAGLGINVVAKVTPSAPGAPQGFVQTMAAQANCLGWYTFDDVIDDNLLDAINAADEYEQWDPKHATFCSALVADLSHTGGIASAFGAESYPLGNNPPGAVVDVYPALATAVADAAGAAVKQCPLAFLQTFAWPSQPPPTPAQYACMFYLALIAGAKGVINYTFFDGSNYLPNYGPLWAYLQTVPAMLKPWVPFLLGGARKTVDNVFVDAATWQIGDQALVLAANAWTTQQTVTVTMPDGTAQEITLAPLGVYSQIVTLQPPSFAVPPAVTGFTLACQPGNPTDGISWGPVDSPLLSVSGPANGQTVSVAVSQPQGTGKIRCTLTGADGVKDAKDTVVTWGPA